jgi:hypothetical protein
MSSGGDSFRRRKGQSIASGLFAFKSIFSEDTMPKSYLVICSEVLAHAANFHVKRQSIAEHILVSMMEDYDWQEAARTFTGSDYCERCGYPANGECTCM